MLKMQFKIDDRAIERLEKKDLMAAIKVGAHKGMIETAAHIQRHKLSGQLLDVRTGALRRSIKANVTTRGRNKVRASVGSDVPYARVHEEGGTIRPKKGRYLTVPTDHVKTAAGVTRGGARSFPDTFVKMIGGTLAVWQKRDNGIIPLFWLVRSVTIRPKRYLRKGMMDKLDTIYRHITREILRVS